MPAKDRRRPFWSRWRWKDWDSKTRHLDPYEYTAYHRLLTFAATVSADLCSVPDDDRILARVCGLGLKKWRSVRGVVLAYFVRCTGPDDVLPGRDEPFRQVNAWYRHETLREDSDAWFQLVENNTERVNRTLSLGTTAGTTAGSTTRARVRSQKKEEPTEESNITSVRHAVPAVTGPMPSMFPPVIELPLRDGSLFAVYPHHLARWTKAFPDVLILDTLREMVVWLDSNPERRKTRRGAMRFITGWLLREQNRPAPGANHGTQARR